jgi:ParB/RepB/Spo0J family partition protein
MTENGPDSFNIPPKSNNMMGQVIEPKLVTLPLSKLVKDPMNPRENLGDLKPLVEDIIKHGFVSAVAVRPLPDGTYGVVRGSRRVEAARIAGIQEIPCYVFDLSDKEALLWALSDEGKTLPLSEEEFYEGLVALHKFLGSWRKVAESLNLPFETVRSMVERFDARKLLEEEGIHVVDRRSKEKHLVNGVKKTTATKFFQAVKRLKAKPEDKKQDTGSQPVEERREPLPSPEEAVKMLDWRPHLFKAVKQGPYLHEVLKRPEAILSIPRNPRAFMKLISADTSPFPSYYPVVNLNPPLDNVRVLLCPSCSSVLRGLAHGAPVACLECGFPNKDIWKPEEE